MAGQIVGFDIGTNQIKMALMTAGKVKKTARADIPEGLIANGSIVSMDAMADFIKTTAKENGIIAKNAAFVIPARQVFTRTVTMPVMNEAQLRLNLPYEFQDYLTEEKSKYVFDYAVLEVVNDEEGKPSEMRLFACAALRSLIDEYKEMFRHAGFNLTNVVPTEWAFAAVLGKLPKSEEDEGKSTVGILDLGYLGSYMHFFIHGEHSSSRSIELGGQDLDTLIADRLGVDEHIARTWKLTNYNGVLEEEGTRELYERLEIELMKAVNFYNYNNRETELNDIYVIGGGAAIKPLMETIGSRINVKVHEASELMSGVFEGEDPWMYVLATGAGLTE